MTAGRGIVHSEMPEQEDGLMWVQLRGESAGQGQDDRSALPRTSRPNAWIAASIRPRVPSRVSPTGSGRIGEIEGPVTDVATAPLYVDVRLQAGAR